MAGLATRLVVQKEIEMASNSLIPAMTQSLVPAVPRKHMAAVQAVKVAAVISAIQLDAAYQLTDQASNDATHLAILHEAMIKAAPLADPSLEALRGAYTRVAVRIIDRMGRS
jgi:hypothetical protein